METTPPNYASQIKEALAGIGIDCVYEDTDARGPFLRFSIAEDTLDPIDNILPAGATSEWAGDSDTNADGDTTEDVRVRWEAVQ